MNEINCAPIETLTAEEWPAKGTGKEPLSSKRWELSTQFASLLDLPAGVEAQSEAREFVPDFVFRLIQLAQMAFAEIVGTPSGILVLRPLKAGQIEKLLAGC